MNAQLAPRETEYCSLLARGLSDKEIARETGVGIGGVRSTGRRCRWKLDARNRTELIVNALRHGIIQLSLVCIIVQSLSLFWDLTNQIDDSDPIRHRGGLRSRITRRSRKAGSTGNRTLLALDTLTNGAASELLQHYDLQGLEVRA